MRFYQFSTLLVLVLSSVVLTEPVKTQERRTILEVSQATSELILDRIFARVPTRDARTAYSVVVRIVSGDELEAQNSIHVSFANAVEAKRARVLNEPALTTALRYKEKSGREDVEEISRLIRVDRRDVAMDLAEARTWQQSMLASFNETTAQLAADARLYNRTGDTRVVLDGTRYELWYKQGMVDWHLSFWDDDLAGNGAIVPLTKWIRTLDKRFERR